MRYSAMLVALLGLAGCGGADGAGGPTVLRSAAAAFVGNDHTCDAPVPSGSAGQVACHRAAQASCPEGTAPNRVDFLEEDGQFLVRGYSCV